MYYNNKRVKSSPFKRILIRTLYNPLLIIYTPLRDTGLAPPYQCRFLFLCIQEARPKPACLL